MALNSPIFLFYFLPVFLLVYWMVGKRGRNLLLLFAGLIFFFWSDPVYFPVILLLLFFNFLSGRWLGNDARTEQQKRWGSIFSILINLAVLFSFKIYATYWQELLALAAQWNIQLPSSAEGYLRKIVGLPLGLSFLVFQSISYLVDITKKRTAPSKNLLNFANYFLLFPKAIAGPIVRYREIADQLKDRLFALPQVAQGLRRFVMGFAKKVLIADQLAFITDQGLFLQPPDQIPVAVAWLGIIAYSLQISFDFAGYSDMAIGLAQALGFRFAENFNYPYISTSIGEFWRRWHISLSTWFRDYVFYPLERKKRSTRFPMQTVNILIVFALTGLWHGVTPGFIVWGILHGAAIAFEQSSAGKWLKNTRKPLQHIYTLLILTIAWVFFRSPSLFYALKYLKTLVGFSNAVNPLPFYALPPISAFTWLALFSGFLLSIPVFPKIKESLLHLTSQKTSRSLAWVGDLLLLILFVIAVTVQAGSTYQPFIYGEF